MSTRTKNSDFKYNSPKHVFLYQTGFFNLYLLYICYAITFLLTSSDLIQKAMEIKPDPNRQAFLLQFLVRKIFSWHTLSPIQFPCLN